MSLFFFYCFIRNQVEKKEEKEREEIYTFIQINYLS
jgi:hypothetical protein